LVACGLAPPNERARQKLSGLEWHVAERIDSMVADANAAAGPLSPTLDAHSLRRIARGLYGSVLARAQARYEVDVYACVVMSSHVHMVLRTPQRNLHAFMGYVNAHVARTVNRITGRRGPLWARRYDAEALLDDPAAEGLTAYTLRNPVAANLVDTHHEWPGLNLAFGVGDRDVLDFEWLNCTAWHRARRPEDLSPFFEKATLRLSPLPHLSHLQRAAYARRLDAWLDDAEKAESARLKRPLRKAEPPARPSLGVRAVVKADFHARSGHPSRSRRPYAFGSVTAKAKERAMMDEVGRQHAVASEAWRRGDQGIPFPPGTYRPPILMAA